MNNPRYEYSAIASKITPLFDGANYAAKVNFCFKYEGAEKTIIDPELGEVYGETAAEAEEKMMNKLREWEKSIN